MISNRREYMFSMIERIKSKVTKFTFKEKIDGFLGMNISDVPNHYKSITQSLYCDTILQEYLVEDQKTQSFPTKGTVILTPSHEDVEDLSDHPDEVEDVDSYVNNVNHDTGLVNVWTGGDQLITGNRLVVSDECIRHVSNINIGTGNGISGCGHGLECESVGDTDTRGAGMPLLIAKSKQRCDSDCTKFLSGRRRDEALDDQFTPELSRLMYAQRLHTQHGTVTNGAVMQISLSRMSHESNSRQSPDALNCLGGRDTDDMTSRQARLRHCIMRSAPVCTSATFLPMSEGIVFLRPLCSMNGCDAVSCVRTSIEAKKPRSSSTDSIHYDGQTKLGLVDYDELKVTPKTKNTAQLSLLPILSKLGFLADKSIQILCTLRDY
jgi:hypothetical protein